MKHPGSYLVSDIRADEWRQHHTPDLAGLFRGWLPEKYFNVGSPRVLYVGKATSGEFDEPEVHSDFFNGNHRFWSFARTIARALDQDDQSLSCIAWSNISKLSRRQIEADSHLLNGLENLAIRTLEDEITRSSPDIIVFVTHHFSDEVVKGVSGFESEARWNRSENESRSSKSDDVWWGLRNDNRHVLWMNHPERTSTERLDFAARKIAYLVNL